MLRRWIIRSLTLGSLLLLFAVWLASYYYDAAISYEQTSDFLIGINGGNACYIQLGGASWDPHSGWATYLQHHKPSEMSLFIRPTSLLGFGYVWENGEGHGLCIPFWFLALLGLALLWFVWGKTQPKPKGGAFPVEITPPKP